MGYNKIKRFCKSSGVREVPESLTTSPRVAHPPEGFYFAGRTFVRQCDKVFPAKIRVSKGRLQVNCVNCLASAGVLVALRTAKTVL